MLPKIWSSSECSISSRVADSSDVKSMTSSAACAIGCHAIVVSWLSTSSQFRGKCYCGFTSDSQYLNYFTAIIFLESDSLRLTYCVVEVYFQDNSVYCNYKLRRFAALKLSVIVSACKCWIDVRKLNLVP